MTSISMSDSRISDNGTHQRITKRRSLQTARLSDYEYPTFWYPRAGKSRFRAGRSDDGSHRSVKDFIAVEVRSAGRPLNTPWQTHLANEAARLKIKPGTGITIGGVMEILVEVDQYHSPFDMVEEINEAVVAVIAEGVEADQVCFRVNHACGLETETSMLVVGYRDMTKTEKSIHSTRFARAVDEYVSAKALRKDDPKPVDPPSSSAIAVADEILKHAPELISPESLRAVEEYFMRADTSEHRRSRPYPASGPKWPT